MASLTYTERGYISSLFNQGGYVLNFNTSKFDRFTMESIEIPLCEKYGLSKGKSLMAFVDEGENHEVATLIQDLLDYYLEVYEEDIEENRKLIDGCKRVIAKLQSGSMVILRNSTQLIDAFDSNYITAQIQQMNAAINDHPADAIGKAKELLESCCEAILKDLGIEIDEQISVNQRIKKVCDLLKLTPNHIPNEAKAAKSIKTVLGNLSSIAIGLAELRNSYGTGHGRHPAHKGLTTRHAKLAVGTATTAVVFLWETHKEQLN